MTIEQISVFVENKAGGLVEVTDIMFKNNIDMRTLSIAETPDFGVLRAIVNDSKKTLEILKDAGYICTATPVLAVAIEDRPGGLNKILHILRDNDINLEYTYAFVTRKSDTAYVVIRVNNNEKAICVLTKNNIKLIDGNEVFKL